MQSWPGNPYPLGATFDGSGTNFALFSSVAEKVELCLLSPQGTEERVEMTEVDAWVWHAYLPGVVPGQRYGYRVHGPWDPADGKRCDPSKLLLDPYARAVDGQITTAMTVPPQTTRVISLFSDSVNAAGRLLVITVILVIRTSASAISRVVLPLSRITVMPSLIIAAAAWAIRFFGSLAN